MDYNSQRVVASDGNNGVEQRLRDWEYDTKDANKKTSSSVKNLIEVSAWESQIAIERNSTNNERMNPKFHLSRQIRTNLVTPLGPIKSDIVEEVFLTMGLCISLELMIVNATSEESDQLSVFACDLPTSTFGLVPLHDFTVAMTTTCTYTPECNVIAVMLIIRILLYHPQVNLKWNSCKHLLLVAILVGQKFWDDYPLRNIDFSTAWSRIAPEAPPLTIKNINSLECIVLGALGFDLFIHTPQYHSFCNELCAAVNHRLSSAADSEEIKSLMQQHAMLIQNRKTKCWYS